MAEAECLSAREMLNTKSELRILPMSVRVPRQVANNLRIDDACAKPWGHHIAYEELAIPPPFSVFVT